MMTSCQSVEPTTTRSVYYHETIHHAPRTRNVVTILPPPPVLPYRSCSIRDRIQEDLAQRQIEAAQMNEMMSGVYGPGNPYSAALLDYQNRNREVNAMLQNPWNSFFSR